MEESNEVMNEVNAEGEIVMDDGTVIRMSDLTFDDVVIPQSEAIPTHSIQNVKPQEKSETVEGKVIKKKHPGKSPLYKGPDKLAMKKKLSEKEKLFVDHYLKTMNATESYRASKGILDKPELWSVNDCGNGRHTKNVERVKQYLNEKILSSADELLDIQMDIIRDEKMPPAVRHDAIKDRLNRMGIGRDKEEATGFTGIGEVTITIKHKAPEVVEGETVETLDNNEKSDV